MRKIIFLSIFVFVLAGNNIFAQELKKEIEIDPKDQICENDIDCIVVYTDCVNKGCECGEHTINQNYRDKYVEFFQKCKDLNMKAGTLVTACHMKCQPPIIKCVDGQCRAINK